MAQGTSNTTYSVDTLPPLGDESAPRKFTGRYDDVEKFMKRCERLFKIHNVTSDKERCDALLEYCSSKVARYIRTLESFVTPDWKTLYVDVLDHFDADRATKRYTVRDLHAFVEDRQRKRIRSVRGFKDYDISYRSIAGELEGRKKIDEKTRNLNYWLGIGKSLRRQIEDQLVKDDPKLTFEDPFDMDKVYKAATKILARDRFDAHTFIDREREESEDESSSDEDASDWRKDLQDSSSDSDTDDRRRSRKKKGKRATTKKNKNVRFKTSREESEGDRFMRETARSRVPPRDQGKATQDEVEDLIKQLNGMKITDASYGLLYFRALKKDSDVAKVVAAPILTVASTPAKPFIRPPTPPASSSRDPPPHLARPASPRPAESSMPPPRNDGCYGCGEIGHNMNSCQKVGDLIRKGTIVRDMNTGRHTYASGLSIRRYNGESLVAAVERETWQTAGVNYARWESSASESESEGGDVPLRVMPVTRAKTAKDGARRMVLDGVYPPALRRSEAKQKDRDNKRGKEEAKNEQVAPRSLRLPERLTPVDTRRPDYNGQDSDAIMEDISTHPTPRAKIARAPKKPALEVQRGARQSTITAAVDPARVLGDVLNTPVSVKLGDLLGVSRELTSVLSENMKKKPVPAIEPAKTYSVRAAPTKGELIRVNFMCNGESVDAFVDTGSELNILSLGAYKSVVRSPMDVRKSMPMSDANGGEGLLRGLVSEVTLSLGNVQTTASFYVGDKAPFSMLLGRPWQRGNYVNIEERMDGTYLVF
ncbi:hypothetical protein FA95DRAFT_1505453, partial [Auriscalpium vulgare]